MNDVQQIQRVLADFCVGVDRMDFPLLESCFHADAEVDFGAFVRGPVADYFAYVKGPDGLRTLERTMHSLGTSTIDVDGDVAHGDTYVVAYHSAPADHAWCKGFVVIWARYVDRFERRDGRWAIASRTCLNEWGPNLTSGEEIELGPENRGRRDRSDLRYRR